MSNIQIPNLPAAVALNGTEQLEGVQSGSSVKLTVAQLGDYLTTTYPPPGVSSIATSAPLTGGVITTTGTIGLSAAGVTNTYLASMAGGTVKANVGGSPATPSDVTPSAVLNVIGSARGSMLYRGATAWSPLTVGASTYLLASDGTDPYWAPPQDVISLTIGSTPITNSSSGALLYNDGGSLAEYADGQDVAENLSLTPQGPSLAWLKGLAVPTTDLTAITQYRSSPGDGQGAIWDWVAGNQSANVSADPDEITWAAPDAASSGTSGAWERRQTLQTVATSPLSAVAYGADGEVYVTPPIVSTTAWSVRDVQRTYVNGRTTIGSAAVTLVNNVANLASGMAIESESFAPGTTVDTIVGTTVTMSSPALQNNTTAVIYTNSMSIRLHVQPAVELTGETVRVRVDGGIHAATRGAHPAQGDWVFGEGPTPYTFELFETDATTRSVWLGEYDYTVDGDAYTGYTYFGGGHCYLPGTLVEASAPLNVMYAWARAHAPARIKLPLGGLYVQAEVVRLTENTRTTGGGGCNTFFFVADYADMTIGSPVTHVIGTGALLAPSYPNEASIYAEGFTVYGNRGYMPYNRGYHAIDLGGDTDIVVPLNVTFVDVHDIGSGGYGMSLGGKNSKMNCLFDHCTFMWSDGDNVDIKNREDDNDHIVFRNCNFGWNALATQGTNIKPPTQPTYLPNNPITTYAGSTRVSILKTNDANARACEFITISGASTFDGVDPNGSWPVVAVDTVVYFDIGQTPAAGGVTGGGATVSMFFPHISIGDCAVDFRGARHSVNVATYTGENFGRNAFRQRGGLAGGSSGEGGTGCTFMGLKITELSPAWCAATNNAGRGLVNLLGVGALAYDITVDTAQSVVFTIGDTASDAQISNFRVTGGSLGAQVRGERCRIHDGIFTDWVNKGVEIHGVSLAENVPLPDDPFTAAVGSNVVNVYQPAHGKTTGDSVSFSAIINANGIAIRPSNTPPAYTLTVVDVDNYTIVATGAALTTDPWGGNSVVANFAGTSHDAIDNQIYNVVFKRTDASTAEAISIGDVSGLPDGDASNTRIYSCTYLGDAAPPYVDKGSNTDWAGLNSGGFLNNIVADTVTASGLTQAGWLLAPTGYTSPGIYDFSVDGATNSIEFTTLGAYSQVMLAVFGLTHGSVSSLNWSVEVSEDNATWKNTNGDYGRAGTSAGTSALVYCGSVAAATPASGVVEIIMFNSALKKIVRMSGGANNATTGVQSQMGFVTAAAALQAVRIVNSGGVVTTGGIVYCLVKA